MDARQFVTDGIKKVFEDLAEAMGDALAEKYGEDMPTGMPAFELMQPEMYLLSAWDKFESGDQIDHIETLPAPEGCEPVPVVYVK